nr:hypothetical protein [Fodinicola feengrottensis]
MSAASIHHRGRRPQVKTTATAVQAVIAASTPITHGSEAGSERLPSGVVLIATASTSVITR